MNMNSDFTLYPSVGRGAGLQIKLSGFTACNAPKWDLENMKTMPRIYGALSSLDNKLVVSCDKGLIRCYEVSTGRLTIDSIPPKEGATVMISKASRHRWQAWRSSNSNVTMPPPARRTLWASSLSGWLSISGCRDDTTFGCPPRYSASQRAVTF